MATVQVTSRVEIDLEEMLNGIARLEADELEKFIDKALALQARRRAPSFSKDESDLLEKINEGMSADEWMRYEALNNKLHEETISPDEHQELLQLIDHIEQADAERMKNLIELARIRKTSVDALLSQLDIRRHLDA